MNKNIIIAILVVVIVAAGAALIFGQQNGKTDTQINFLNNETFQNGEQVVFGLNEQDSIINTYYGKFNGTKVTV